MNLAMPDVELVNCFCDSYSLSVGSVRYVDYFAFARTIRHVFNDKNLSTRRGYIKSLKYAFSGHSNPYFFERLMSRICLNSGRILISNEDINIIEEKVKRKLGVSHCHHSCYNFLRGYSFKVKHCPFCGATYFVSCFELQSFPCCSARCQSMLRIDKRLNYLYQKNKISRRYRLTKGENKIHKLVNYLSNQQKTKATKKNKGNFKWC